MNLVEVATWIQEGYRKYFDTYWSEVHCSPAFLPEVRIEVIMYTLYTHLGDDEIRDNNKLYQKLANLEGSIASPAKGYSWICPKCKESVLPGSPDECTHCGFVQKRDYKGDGMNLVEVATWIQEGYQYFYEQKKQDSTLTTSDKESIVLRHVMKKCKGHLNPAIVIDLIKLENSIPDEFGSVQL